MRGASATIADLAKYRRQGLLTDVRALARGIIWLNLSPGFHGLGNRARRRAKAAQTVRSFPVPVGDQIHDGLVESRTRQPRRVNFHE
jgi:hypothetical protein